MIWLYIAAGGAVGAVARYGLAGWVQDRTGFQFPWGTFVVNVLGSLLIGAALEYLEATPLSAEVRGLVAVGLLGGFTTFSTFSYETVGLLEEGAFARAAVYSFGSLLVGLVAVYAGMAAAGFLVRARG
jgi:CrcB protein